MQQHLLSNIYYLLSIICRGQAAPSIICRGQAAPSPICRKSGFTLLELLIVMGLMVVVTTITVSGAFGMARASSYLAAENVLLRSLQATRQIACTSGKRMVIAFVGPDSGDNKGNSFVSIEAAGTVTEEIVGKYIRDRTASYLKYTSEGRETLTKDNRTVWNLRSGGKFKGATIDSYERERLPIPGAAPDNLPHYRYNVTQIMPSNGKDFKVGDWQKGDPYGFQLADIQYMPANFKIGINGPDDGSTDGKLIVFEPDGTVCLGKANNGEIVVDSSPFVLYVYEPSKSSIASKISVKDGFISVIKRKEG